MKPVRVSQKTNDITDEASVTTFKSAMLKKASSNNEITFDVSPSRMDSNAINHFPRNLSQNLSNDNPENNGTILDSFHTDHEPLHHGQTGKIKRSEMNFFQQIAHHFREGSSLGSIITLVMTVAVGSGVLSLPYAVSASGWAFAIIQMALCAVLCNFSLQIMTKVGKVTKQHTYSTVAEQLFGKRVALFVQIIFFLNNWGSAAADLILVNDLITKCFTNLNIPAIPWIFTDPRSNFWPIFLGVFVGFPLCLKRSFKELRFILFTAFILTVYGILVIFKDAVSSNLKMQFSYSDAFIPMGIFTTLPITFYSFACHPIVLDGYKELEIPNERKYRRVLRATMVVLLISYITIGVFGYLTFASNVYKLSAGNILLAYNPGDVPIDLSILFFALTITVSLPLGMKPIKAVLVEMVNPKGKPESTLKHISLTAIVVGSVIICSCLVSNMTLIVRFMGSSFNTLIMFNLPCIFYLKLIKSRNNRKSWRYYTAHVVNVCVFLFSLFCIGYLVYCEMNGMGAVGG